MEFLEHEGKPFEGKKLAELKNFLSKSNLEYDENIEYTLNILNDDYDIIATGSLHGNTLKCIAVDDEYRGEGLASKLISGIVRYAISIGRSKLFLFTKPKNKPMFGDLGFYKIAQTRDVLLMENSRNGFKSYLDSIESESASLIKSIENPQKIGAIVANCNPFTLGHRFLIETASKECDILHVFILAGDRKYFTEEERYNLVKKGCADLTNVIVHSAGEYLISPVTFPTYFIKEKYKSAEINCELDLEIFKNIIAKKLNITDRFVATEPNDIVTNSYNEQMIKSFKDSNVRLTIIDRKEVGSEVISATKVRKFIINNDIKNIKEFVPQVTYDLIKSKFRRSS